MILEWWCEKPTHSEFKKQAQVCWMFYVDSWWTNDSTGSGVTPTRCWGRRKSWTGGWCAPHHPGRQTDGQANVLFLPSTCWAVPTRTTLIMNIGTRIPLKWQVTPPGSQAMPRTGRLGWGTIDWDWGGMAAGVVGGAAGPAPANEMSPSPVVFNSKQGNGFCWCFRSRAPQRR